VRGGNTKLARTRRGKRHLQIADQSIGTIDQRHSCDAPVACVRRQPRSGIIVRHSSVLPDII
jgi:hypothetical protein